MALDILLNQTRDLVMMSEVFKWNVFVAYNKSTYDIRERIGNYIIGNFDMDE